MWSLTFVPVWSISLCVPWLNTVELAASLRDQRWVSLPQYDVTLNHCARSQTGHQCICVCAGGSEMITALREITAHFMAAFFSKRCNNAHSDTSGLSVSSRPGSALEFVSILHIFCGRMLALKWIGRNSNAMNLHFLYPRFG